jgi:hypothetical protein
VVSQATGQLTRHFLNFVKQDRPQTAEVLHRSTGADEGTRHWQSWSTAWAVGPGLKGVGICFRLLNHLADIQPNAALRSGK